MQFFFKKDNPPVLFHFREENYPYEPTPAQPLVHGTLENGDIDWDFWKKQEVWTLAQAIGLMQGYPGDEWHSLAYDHRNRDYIDKLDTLIASGLDYTIFKKVLMNQLVPVTEKEHAKTNKPQFMDILGHIRHKKESVRETSEVFPKEFVRWAYENHFVLPVEVLDMLPPVLNDSKKSQEHKNLTINIKPYIEAWQQKVGETSWANRRAVTAHLLAEVGFTAKQIYMALSGKGEAEADPDRQVRKWKEKGKLLVSKNIEAK